MKARKDISEITHKDVIVIGNGPSGLSLSYMLSGNIPYLISDAHPDEMLSARLRPIVGKSLVSENLRLLAEGLEGRSTNLISLLLDALIHPYADMGLELPSLVEWRTNGHKINHLVLGKGPPGGAWHSMDPQILTLSLGSWMSLPGLPFSLRDGSEKRAYAGNVAKYYEEYAHRMNLQDNFKSNVCVTKVLPMRKCDIGNTQVTSNNTAMDQIVEMDCSDTEDHNHEKTRKQQCKWVRKVKDDAPEKRRLCLIPEVCNRKKMKSCPFSSAFNLIGCGKRRKLKEDRCFLKFNFRDIITQPKSVAIDQDMNADSQNLLTSDFNTCSSTDARNNLSETLNCYSLCDWQEIVNCQDPVGDNLNTEVPTSTVNPTSDTHCSCPENMKPRWLVEVYDTEQQGYTTYLCNDLVLANGISDIPNKLKLVCDKLEPDWFVYTVRHLEIALDKNFQNNCDSPDPVLVVGAGLSAADAIIATRGRNIPVLHIFKEHSEGLNKQLPENMYPEYHKVHQMMIDGGSSYPLYTALPGYALSDFDSSKRTVVLTSNLGKTETYNVSFAAILIGSKPDLQFLPDNFKLGIRKDVPVDCKTNPIDVNQFTHSVNGYDGLYVMGPLVGDNFVRFIPGGALAILSELYRKYGY